jgi:hypothetical protein
MNLAIGQQHNPQAVGSAITYARRYALQSALLIPTEDDDGESAMKPVREDQAIGDRQNRRETESEKARNYSKGWKDAEEKLRDANRALLEASEGQRRTSPPEKPVQAKVERAKPYSGKLTNPASSENEEYPGDERVGDKLEQTKSWQDVICTYGKKDGPLRDRRLGDLDMSQLQFLYTMFGKPDLSQINPKDRLLAVAIRDWNASLDKEEVPDVPF